MKRMACSLTIDAVRERRKTVTRRHVDTWKTLAAGDRLLLIEKGMGLPAGSHQVVLAEVEIIDVRVEPLIRLWKSREYGDDELEREGIDTMSPNLFAYWWAESHGYGKINVTLRCPADLAPIMCRRIEWRYA
jgi:hypothetical protein